MYIVKRKLYIYIYSVVIQSSRVDEKKVRVNLSVEKYRLKKSYVNVKNSDTNNSNYKSSIKIFQRSRLLEKIIFRFIRTLFTSLDFSIYYVLYMSLLYYLSIILFTVKVFLSPLQSKQLTTSVLPCKCLVDKLSAFFLNNFYRRVPIFVSLEIRDTSTYFSSSYRNRALGSTILDKIVSNEIRGISAHVNFRV